MSKKDILHFGVSFLGYILPFRIEKPKSMCYVYFI